jgi:hypothetical protein
LARLGDLLIDRSKADGLTLDVRITAQLGIDGNKPVFACDLDAMAGVKHERNFGPIGLMSKINQGFPQIGRVDVVEQGDLKSKPFQRMRDIGGIAGWIGERRHFHVRAIANDQGDAIDGEGRTGKRQARQSYKRICQSPSE